MNEKKAKKLIEKFRVPKHIQIHCQKVANIAKKIAEEYEKKGIKVDVDLLYCAGLLHDIFRVVDIDEDNYKKMCEEYGAKEIKIWDELRKKYKDMEHPDAAYEYFYENGEEKIALLIKKHKFDGIVDHYDFPFTLEEIILTYADKRVLHDHIVTMKKRFEDGQKRYNPHGYNKEEEALIHKRYFQLEKSLFEKIDINPDDIK